jgi:hypothetical protein
MFQLQREQQKREYWRQRIKYCYRRKELGLKEQNPN